MTTRIGHSNNAPHAPKPPKAEPQTLHDVVLVHQEAVDKLDIRLRDMADPSWLGTQRERMTHKRDVAKHELDILKAAEAH